MPNTYTYRIYPANFAPQDDDRDGKRAAAARDNFGFNPSDEMYSISVNGRMNTIQAWDNYPHPAETSDLSAQAHIAALEAADAEAESTPSIPAGGV